MTESAMSEYFGDVLAVRQPLLKLAQGGLIVVKTFACNEIQVRLVTNIASLQRRNPNLQVGSKAKPRDGSLVLCGVSQTDVETGEIVGMPRDRKFSPKARHFIRECGAVLTSVYDKRVYFITLTLPGSTVAAVEAFAMYDKQIKNAYLQNFRKLWAKVFPGRPFAADYCVVSEWQERGAIHFHIALGLPTERFAKLVKRLYRGWWYKILVKYSEKSGANLFLSHDGRNFRFSPGNIMVECERVDKSVESYLAKYLSKTRSKEGMETVNSPSRWWSVSTALRKKAEKERLAESFTFDTFEESQEIVESMAAVIKEETSQVMPMVNSFTDDPLGFILFPTQERKGWIFEWLKELARHRVLVPIEETARMFAIRCRRPMLPA